MLIADSTLLNCAYYTPENTRLPCFSDGLLEDLEEGASVTLMGQRGEQGEMRAAVLLLGDAGAGAFGGLAGAFGAEGLRAGGEQINPEDIAALRRAAWRHGRRG